MTLYHLIYTSRPFGYDEATLGAILTTARANNARDGVTGTLICRDDLFLQFLEGPERAVTAAFDRITHDDRHLEINRLHAGSVRTRRFPGWAMRHDPVRDWMWSRAEVDAGALSGATSDNLLQMFDRVASDPEHATPRACPMA